MSQEVENKYYKHNFVRVDGKNAFIELSDYPLSIGKMLLRFCHYNPNNDNKQDNKIDIYLDILDFLGLCNLVESNYLLKKADFFKKNNKINDSLYEKLSGSTRERAQQLSLPFQLPEGKCVSKTFKIIPSTKYCYNLMASYRLGVEADNGLIIPEGRTLSYIQVPMEHVTLAGLMAYGKLRITAYETVRIGTFKNEYRFTRD